MRWFGWGLSHDSKEVSTLMNPCSHFSYSPGRTSSQRHLSRGLSNNRPVCWFRTGKWVEWFSWTLLTATQLFPRAIYGNDFQWWEVPSSKAQHRLMECDQYLLAKWTLELKHDPKINPRMFLPQLPFLEQRTHQMSFNLKRKQVFRNHSWLICSWQIFLRI